MTIHAHDLVARNLDQIAPAEGFEQARRFIDQSAQVCSVHFPAQDELASHELGIAVDQQV
jgi:hypothetical protein